MLVPSAAPITVPSASDAKARRACGVAPETSSPARSPTATSVPVASSTTMMKKTSVIGAIAGVSAPRTSSARKVGARLGGSENT